MAITVEKARALRVKLAGNLRDALAELPNAPEDRCRTRNRLRREVSELKGKLAVLSGTMLPTKACPMCDEGNPGSRTRYDGSVETCYGCDGKGRRAAPSLEDILGSIVSSRGPSKGKMRRSRPPYKKGARAYFVWRLARFHGGADMCLPMAAEMDVRGDPYRAELECMAEMVAARAFGSAKRGTQRWAYALGYADYPTVPGETNLALLLGAPGSDIGGPEDSPEWWIDKGREI